MISMYNISSRSFPCLSFKVTIYINVSAVDGLYKISAHIIRSNRNIINPYNSIVDKMVSDGAVKNTPYNCAVLIWIFFPW